MNFRNQKRRDWFCILRDLMRANVSMTQVAKHCGRAVGSVAHWADGGQPKDTDARIVLALYRKHCPEAYVKHMQEFEPDVLKFHPVVLVQADKGIRGRPRPQKVVVREVKVDQIDMFEGVV